MARNGYLHRRRKALRERALRMNKVRWEEDRRRRDEDTPERMRQIEEVRVENLPRTEGDVLGRLEWVDSRTGRARRWVVRIGARADQVTLETPCGKRTGSHGWAWMMDHLRGFLCGRKG